MIRLRHVLAALAGLTSAAPAIAETAARDWITAQSGHQARWTNHGTLALPSGQIFFGDPTWGDDYHIRDPHPAPAPELQIWTMDAPDGRSLLVWLEATGTLPSSRGDKADFGMDAAMFALGDLDAGTALVSWGEALQDQGNGDSLEWLQPHLMAAQFYAKWLPVPPHDLPIFIVGTGTDGGLGAVWLIDRPGRTSGILIDIAGRAEDGRFIDLLLPEQAAGT